MSWEQLLIRIAEKYFASQDTVDSAPLAFEQLKCAVLSNNIRVTTDSFAVDVLNELDRLPQAEYNALAKRFLDLKIEKIITTNIDYNIERCLIDDYEYAKYTSFISMPQERKCSSIRHISLCDKKIFHIHGELGKKGTICLGNVHYAENLNSIMNRILNHSKEDDSYSLKDSVFSEELISWAQYFFTNDIYIVGLGLYESDMDLWWLISYRRQLMLGGDNRIKNRIVYFYLYEEKDQSFVNCLKDMGIVVQEKQIKNGEWVWAYQKSAEIIREQLEEIF